MLLSRDYVGHMAKEVIKRLIAGKMIEVKHLENVTTQVRQVMAEEVTIEDRINEEVRVILEAYQQDMLKSGAQYAEMFKKIKGELARRYKAVL